MGVTLHLSAAQVDAIWDPKLNEAEIWSLAQRGIPRELATYGNIFAERTGRELHKSKTGVHRYFVTFNDDEAQAMVEFKLKWL